ncbi:MAG: response regulator transcription factor [Phaeodactylibacter sp.]|nr:response regulator transcription factor [Phaeodactylibacter sp.]
MNRPLQCLAVDDEPHALELLSLYIEKTPFLELSHSTTSPWEALSWLQQGKAGLIFLDIQMDELTGIQLLQIAGKTCPVILTTAYSEYALESYEYQVADYLLKPYSFERFLKAVNGVWQQQQEEQASPPHAPDYLFVKGDAKNKFHRLHLSEICYIEGLRNYVRYIGTAKKSISLQNLKELEGALPPEQFVRIHKSFIINLVHVEQVEGNSVLVNGRRLPVGSSYRRRLFELIERYRMG